MCGCKKNRRLSKFKLNRKTLKTVAPERLSSRTSLVGCVLYQNIIVFIQVLYANEKLNSLFEATRGSDKKDTSNLTKGCVHPVADPGGMRGPVKVSHKNDGHQRRPHRFHVSRPPPYPAAGSATAIVPTKLSDVSKNSFPQGRNSSSNWGV